MKSKLAELLVADAEKITGISNIFDLNKKTILITGASGLIGSYLLAYLYNIRKNTKYNFRVIALSNHPLPEHLSELLIGNDLNMKVDLSSIGNSEKIPESDYIIHAAGYGQPGKFLEDPVKTISLNTTGTIRLLNSLKKSGTFLFLSSSEIYSGLDSPIYSEDQIGTTTPQHPRSCYIEGKRCGEAICKAFSDKNKIKTKIARLSLVYGPGVRIGDQRVINTFIQKSIKKVDIDLLDSGEALRTYLYITDAIKVITNILINSSGNLYNVGGISRTSIIELAKTIASITDVKVSVPTKGSSLLGSPNDVKISMKKYEEEFGNISHINLREGLINTINWYKEMNI